MLDDFEEMKDYIAAQFPDGPEVLKMIEEYKRQRAETEQEMAAKYPEWKKKQDEQKEGRGSQRVDQTESTDDKTAVGT